MKKVCYIVLLVLAVLMALLGCRSVPAKTPDYDFYGYVNDQWLLDNSELIDAFGYVDSATLCWENIIQAFITHFDTAEPADELESMLFSAYRSALDFESRNAADYSELHAILEKIESAATIEELVDVDSEIYRDTGASTLVNFSPDMISFFGSYKVSLFAPVVWAVDADYTIEYYQKLLNTLGISKDKEVFLAGWELDNQHNSLKNQVIPLPESTVNFTNLKTQFGVLDLEKICRDRHIMQTGSMTKQPSLDLSTLISLLLESDVEHVRTYMEMSLLGRFAPFLWEEVAGDFFAFIGENNRLYKNDLVSCTKRYMVEYMMGSWYPLMELIFDRYIVKPEDLQDVKDIADTVLASYLEVIDQTALFNETIRQKIRRGLERVEINVGLPPRDVSYYVSCNPEIMNFWQCVTSITKCTDQYVYDSRIKENDRVRGTNTSYTVNAFGGSLAINVLGGYLMSPNYSPDMSISCKYGAIGVMLAHEFSHIWGAGSVYNKPIDGYDRMIRLYDGYEEYSGVTCIGKQVSTEAAADIFGLQVALHALEQQTAEPDYKAFFLGFANMYQSVSSEYYDNRSMNVMKDNHPLSRSRINCSVINMNQFYIAFDIHPGNTMYLPESDRFRL